MYEQTRVSKRRYHIFAVVVHAFFTGVWAYILSKHDVFNTEGFQYSQFNGLYYLCGIISVACLIVNMRIAPRLTGKKWGAIAILSGIYAIAMELANYSLFEEIFEYGAVIPWMVGAFVGGFLVCFQILVFGITCLPLTIKKISQRSSALSVFFLTFASVACIYLVYFFNVAYPGYFTTDSLGAIGQAIKNQYNNTSPFWHTMLVKLCIDIGTVLGGEGNSAVSVYAIVQAITMAAIFAYTVTTLYQAGIPKYFIAIVYGMYALLSYNVAYAVTMWKDVPFSGAALLVVVSLYRILKGIGKNRTLNYVVFGIGGIAFCTMRTNGWYAYLAIAIALLIMTRRQHKKLIALLGVVLAVAWLGNNPLLDALGVEEGDFVEALAVPFQQISRVVVENGEISDEDKDMLEQIFDLEKVKEYYDPLTVDPIKFKAFRGNQRDYLREHLAEYASLWLKLGKQNPWLYLKAWIDETQGYWNAGYHYWIYPTGGSSEKYGITRPALDNIVKRGFERLFHFMESTPPITQPLYGIGFQVWILMFCLIVNAFRKRQETLLTIPIVVIVVGLWLGTPVFAEFRYAYPVFITVPFLLNITVFQSEKI